MWLDVSHVSAATATTVVPRPPTAKLSTGLALRRAKCTPRVRQLCSDFDSCSAQPTAPPVAGGVVPADVARLPSGGTRGDLLPPPTRRRPAVRRGHSRRARHLRQLGPRPLRCDSHRCGILVGGRRGMDRRCCVAVLGGGRVRPASQGRGGRARRAPHECEAILGPCQATLVSTSDAPPRALECGRSRGRVVSRFHRNAARREGLVAMRIGLGPTTRDRTSGRCRSTFASSTRTSHDVGSSVARGSGGGELS